MTTAVPIPGEEICSTTPLPVRAEAGRVGVGHRRVKVIAFPENNNDDEKADSYDEPPLKN